ncbi:MAG: hypothetical protein MJ252_00330 [archaeon]|nr:hypothetical protein [archaeon]
MDKDGVVVNHQINHKSNISDKLLRFISEKNIKIEKEKEKSKNSNGSLYKLFKSEYFTIDLLLEYLHNKNNESIQDFLINLLFNEKYKKDLILFVPQFCAMVKYLRYKNSLISFIIEKSVEISKFGVFTSWYLNSFISDSNKNDRFFLNIIDRILTEQINQKFKPKRNNFDDELIFYFEKEKRVSYYTRTLNLFTKICSLCQRLKKIINDNTKIQKMQRKKFLDEALNSFNKEINGKYKQYTEENNKAKTNLKIRKNYFGIILPFLKYENNVIVNFIPKLSFCFTTKARVPVKITVECIDLEDYASIYTSDTVDNPPTEKYEFQNEEEEEKQNQEAINENKKNAEKIINNIKYINEHPELEEKKAHTMTSKSFEKKETLVGVEDKDIEMIRNSFGNDWDEEEKEIKKESKFRNFSSLKLVSFIAKANDDLRQEQMTMQIIKKFQNIFEKEGLPLKLCPYEIIITSSSSGLIEFLPNTLSIDAIKKRIDKLNAKISFNQFFRLYFCTNFVGAQKNFVDSLAAYSLVSYLIAIKDRHNGNILLDKKGNLIQIDFGFILGISPGGNLNFENAPFKLTKDYIQIMDGIHSEIFLYFKSQFLKGLLTVRKYYQEFVSLIEIMADSGDMPCFFEKDKKEIIQQLTERFLIGKGINEVEKQVEILIDKAASSWRTTQYDIFQKLSNDIMP